MPWIRKLWRYRLQEDLSTLTHTFLLAKNGADSERILQTLRFLSKKQVLYHRHLGPTFRWNSSLLYPRVEIETLSWWLSVDSSKWLISSRQALISKIKKLLTFSTIGFCDCTEFPKPLSLIETQSLSRLSGQLSLQFLQLRSISPELIILKPMARRGEPTVP